MVFEGANRPLNLLSFLAGKEEINFKQKGKLADLRSAMSAGKRLSTWTTTTSTARCCSAAGRYPPATANC